MSGGHFNYSASILDDMVDEIEHIINNNNSNEKDEYGFEIGRHYSEETIKKFNSAVQFLRAASAMVHRIDYLICGDDGEESFNERWVDDLNELIKED